LEKLVDIFGRPRFLQAETRQIGPHGCNELFRVCHALILTVIIPNTFFRKRVFASVRSLMVAVPHWWHTWVAQGTAMREHAGRPERLAGRIAGTAYKSYYLKTPL
jgi:hypothetical protein